MNTDTYFDSVPTSLGLMVLASDGDALMGAWFDGQRHQPPVGSSWLRRRNLPILLRAAHELDEYFAGARTEFALPLAPRGSPFQRDVWQAIAAVPYGATIAYRDLAIAIGRPASIRAAAAATGRNPLSIFVPCHRIVGADGALTGYAGGIERKRTLLALELSVSAPRHPKGERLPPGGKAPSAEGAHESAPGHPQRERLAPGGKARSAKGAPVPPVSAGRAA